MHHPKLREMILELVGRNPSRGRIANEVRAGSKLPAVIPSKVLNAPVKS